MDDIEGFNAGWEANQPIHSEPPPREDAGRSYRESEPPGDMPFRCLGHDRGRYYFLPEGAGQVVALTARDLHSAAELVALAPLRWWEAAYPGRESFSTKMAGDAMMRACEGAGVYDPDALRGRGVWLDEGRTILHLGNRLLCDGQVIAPMEAPGRHIYEASRPLPVDLAGPIDNKTASGLLRLCCQVAWANPERDGRLLAGWLVIALACGAMPWRPHLWITSEAGGGKTWVLDNIINPVLAGLALHVQSKTTEAGLRGMLRLDARPVVFDEAETQNDQDRARLQQVLDLARAASSEGGADIAKGTRDGGVQLYRIRSCFVFSSINLGLDQAADESRTIVLNIDPPQDKAERAAAFAKLKTTLLEVMQPGFSAGLLARTLGLLPTIRHNAEVLATAISASGVGRRTGDVLGVILAGAYSLTSTRRLDPETAAAFLAERQWVKDTAQAAEAEPEWQRALYRLVQTETRVTNVNGKTEATTIGDMIAACAGHDIQGLMFADADMGLRRRGIRVNKGEVRIANRSEAAAAAFAGTPWASAWRATLARTPGAKRDVAERFTPTLQDKAVSLPLRALLRDGS
ncbi:hypothetical protein [Roseomonas xinghualingensis]|uniref:hypothetical protein n=1 Tax=Roseomonas xinghualingensis TaxID=2986475 RepID=UPI0021F245C0|nr:hypothetical protein [Roseomonas sp. SXEYE001]MCV4209971.1 hypothetical protein [Roseomonas sp. SXEYE001]